MGRSKLGFWSAVQKITVSNRTWIRDWRRRVGSILLPLLPLVLLQSITRQELLISKVLVMGNVKCLVGAQRLFITTLRGRSARVFARETANVTDTR